MPDLNIDSAASVRGMTSTNDPAAGTRAITILGMVVSPGILRCTRRRSPGWE